MSEVKTDYHEHVLVASVLLHNQVSALFQVEPKEFEDKAARKVWEVLKEYGEVDEQALQKRCPQELSECLEAMPTQPDVALTRWRRWKARKLCISRVEKGLAMMKADHPFEEAKTMIEAGLCEGHLSASSISLVDAASTAYAEVSSGQGLFVPSGYPAFDEQFGGIQRDGLIIIAGRPSMGKTALAVSMSRMMGESIFFSGEMSSSQLSFRYMAAETGVDIKALSNGRLSKDAFSKVAESLDRLPSVHIIDEGARSIFDIESETMTILNKGHDVSCVIIDYLQILKMPKAENRNLAIGAVTGAMKNLAKRIQRPVILLSQLNRELERRDNKRPMLSDLKESGSIEQDADQIIFPFRPEVYAPDREDLCGFAELIVGKNRNGPIGSIDMQWDGKSAHYTELKYS